MHWSSRNGSKYLVAAENISQAWLQDVNSTESVYMYLKQDNWYIQNKNNCKILRHLTKMNKTQESKTNNIDQLKFNTFSIRKIL